MALSTDLISQFSKITNDNNSEKKDTTLYGTVTNIVDNGDDTKTYYVQMDGSSVDTPVVSTVELNEDDRVLVSIKNHTATVTGNMTNIALGKMTEGNLRSEISQTAASIRTEVTNTASGLSSQITQNATSITSIVTKQDEFSEFKQTFDTFEFINENGKVKISSGNLQLTGAISFGDIEGSDDVLSDIEAAKSAADGVDETLTALLDADDKTTYIDGSKIVTESLYVDKIKLGEMMTVYKDLSGEKVNSNIGGYLGYDSGFNSSSGIGIKDSTEQSQVVCTDLAARLSHGDPSEDYDYAQVVASYNDDAGTYDVSLDAYDRVYLKHIGTVVAQTYNDGANDMLLPGSNSEVYLGKSSHYWLGVYSDNYFGGTASATSSDRNLKNNIEDLPDKYVKMFDQLRPVRYKLNDGTSDRYHVGYIAQEVEDAMTAAGIDSQEFGGLIKDKDEDDSYTYMLRYDEFDGIRDAKIKQLESQLVEAYAMISELKTRLDNLEAKEVS